MPSQENGTSRAVQSVRRDAGEQQLALLKSDRRGNLHPAKQRPEQKIGAAVALMMAVGRAMTEDDGQGDITDFLRNPVIV